MSGRRRPPQAAKRTVAAPRRLADVGLNREAQVIADGAGELSRAGIMVVHQLVALAVAVECVVRLLDENKVACGRSGAGRLAVGDSRVTKALQRRGRRPRRARRRRCGKADPGLT